MSPENDKFLCEKYPKIFANRNKSPRESCFGVGFEYGDGWKRLTELLCEALTYTYMTSVKVGDKYVEVEPPQVICAQAKEKFGTLRFYYDLKPTAEFAELCKVNDEAKKVAERYVHYIDGVVHFAEILSGRTCEVTGLDGEMHCSNGGRSGWYRTLNREYAKTLNLNFVPVADLAKE